MRIVCLFLLLGSAACTDFDPRSLLQAPRVVGIVAEPPEIRLGGTVSLTAVEYNPEPIERTWSVCLFSLGVFTDFACIDPSLVVPIPETTAAVEVTFDPATLSAFAALGDPNRTSDLQAACGQACVGRDGQRRTFVDVQVELETKWADGSSMKTIKSIRLRLDDSPLNTNPVISDLRVNDEEAPDPVAAADRLRLTVRLDGDSLESYVDTDGRTRDEEATLTWYSTAGEFTLPITFGDNLGTTLVLPKVLTEPSVDLFVVARDGRGGTAFLTKTLPVVGAEMGAGNMAEPTTE